jgi:hypothetical protein
MSEREQTAGGTLGRLAAAERERRVEEARAEGAKRQATAEQGAGKREAGDLKRAARRAKEAADAIEPREKS